MKQKLDCLLLSPHFRYVKGSIYREVSNLDPPMGLLALSAFLIERGFKTMVFDLNIEIKSNSEILDFFIKIENEYDLDNTVFGISFLTSYVYSSYEIGKNIRLKYADALVVAGGPHATFMSEEILSSGFVDIAVRGEGELTLLEIIQKKTLPEIPGISYLQKKHGETQVIHNPDRERIKSLDELPFPAYHQLAMDKYKPILGSCRKLPAANIVSSRGCPGKCNFCCKTFGTKVYFKSPDRIIEEIKFLKNNYKIKHINFYDDTFTLNRTRVLKFCELMIQERLKIEWTCFGRIDNMDEEMLKKMKKAGCYQIMYGVENFDQDILDSLNKGFKVEKIEEVIKQTKKAGILTRVSVMVGNIDDTWDTYRNNIKMLKKTKPDILVSSIFTPIPGSYLYEWALKNNRLLTRDWSKFVGNNSVVKLNHLTQEEVVEQFRKIYSDYYYNLPYFLRRIKRLKSFSELKNSIRAFFYVLKFILHF